MAGRGRGTHIRVKKLEKPRPLRSVSEDLTAVNQAFEPDNQKEDIDDVFLGEEEYDRRTQESYADSRVPPLPDGSMLNWVRAIEYELEKGNYIDADIQAICESIQMKGPLMDRINPVCLDPVFEAVRRVIRQPDLTGLDRLSLLEVIEMRANDWEPNGPRHEFYTKAYPQMEARFAAENRDAGTYASKRMIHNTLNIKLAPELQREPPHIQADGDTYEPNNNPPNIDKLNFVKQVEELCLQNGNNKDKESEIDSPDIPVYDSPCHIPVRSDNINPILATLEKVINERKLNIPQKKLTASRSVKKFMKSVSEDNEIQIIKELYGKKSDCEFINDVVDHDTDKFTPKEAHDITRLVTKEDNQKTLQFPVQNTPAVDLTKMKDELKNLQLTTNIHENKPSKSARPHSLEDSIAFRRSNSENDVGHNYYEKESIGKLSLVNDKYKGPSKKKWRDEWLMRNFDEEGSGSSYESSRASTVSPPIERMSSLRMDAEDIFKPQDNKKKKSDTTIFSISIRDSKVFTHKVCGFIAMATDTSIQRIEGLGDSEVAIFEISGPIKGRNLAVARIAEYCQSIVKNPREWVQQHDLLKQQQQQKVKNEPPPRKEDPVINHISDKAQWEDNCGQYVYHLTIKSSIMGRLLGVQGQRIKVIEEESETNISVYKNDKDLMYRPAVVYGPSIEAVGIAVDMIEECIALNAEPSRIPRSRVVSTSSHLSTASSYTLSESDSPHTDRDHGHASRNYESQGGIQMQQPNAVIKYTQATSQSKSDVPMTPRGRGRGRGMMSLKKEAPPPGISRQVSCPAICSQSESSKVPLVVSPSTNLKRSEDDLDWEDVDSGETFKFGQKHYGVTSFAINQAAPYNGLGTKGDDKATKPINKSSGIINTSPTTLSQDMPSNDARDMFPEEKDNSGANDSKERITSPVSKPIRGLKSRQAKKLNIELENTSQNAQETIIIDKMRESNNSMTSPSSPARPSADTPPKEAPLRIIHRSPKRPESSVKAPNEQLAEDEQVKGQSKETIAAEMQKLETTIRQLSLDDNTLIEAFENVRRKLNQGQDDNETLETNPFAEKTSPVQVSMSRKLEFDNERSKLEKGNVLNWRKGAVKTPPVDQYASGDPPRLFHERDSSRLFHERDPPRLFKRSLSHQETSSSSWRRNETMDQGMFSSSTSEDGSFGEAASASKGPVWRPPNREFRAGSGSHPSRGNAVAFLRQPLGALQTDDLFDSVEETMPVGPNTATHRRHLFRETSTRFHAKQLLKQTPTLPKYRYNRTELFRGMTSLVGLSMPHEWMYLVRTLPEICLKEPHHPNLRKLSTELQESAKKRKLSRSKSTPEYSTTSEPASHDAFEKYNYTWSSDTFKEKKNSIPESMPNKDIPESSTSQKIQDCSSEVQDSATSAKIQDCSSEVQDSATSPKIQDCSSEVQDSATSPKFHDLSNNNNAKTSPVESETLASLVSEINMIGGDTLNTDKSRSQSPFVLAENNNLPGTKDAIDKPSENNNTEGGKETPEEETEINIDTSQVLSYSAVARAPPLTDQKFGEPSFGNMVSLTKTSQTFTKTEISQPNQGSLSCIQRLLPPRLSTTSKVPEMTSVTNIISGGFPGNTQHFRDQSHGRVNYEHIQNTSIYGATGTGHTSYPMVAGQQTMFSYPSAIHGVPQSMNPHMFHHVAQPLLPITQSTQSIAQPMMHPAQYMGQPMLPAQSMTRHPFSAQPMLNMVQPSQPMYAMARPVQSNQALNQFTSGLPVTNSVNSGTNISLQHNQSFSVPTSQYTQPFGSNYKNQ